jgi:hypothetical protein
VDPNGKVSRVLDLSVEISGDMIMCQDTVSHRLFMTLRGGLEQRIRPNYWSPQTIDYANRTIFKERLVVCLDTGLRVLWTSAFTCPDDSTALIQSLHPDGSGGVYVGGEVGGSISNAAQSGNNGEFLTRLKGGFSFLTRLGKNGKVKWRRILPHPNIQTSPLMPTGYTFLFSQKPGQLDVLIPFADTLIANYAPAGVTGKPNQFQLQLSRFDSLGNLLRNRRGNLTTPYFPQDQQPLELVRVDSGGQIRWILMAERLLPYTQPASGILQFDTAFQFLQGTAFPFFRYDGSIADLGNFQVAVLGTDLEIESGLTLIRQNLIRMHVKSLNPSRWWTARNPCSGLYNPMYPNLTVRKNGDNTADILVHHRSGGSSLSQKYACSSVYFRENKPLPCRPFQSKTNPSSFEDISSQVTLIWQSGGFLWQTDSRPVWRDSTVSAFSSAGSSQLVNNICIDQPSLNFRDSTYCGDSLILRSIGVYFKDQTLVNGLPIPPSLNLVIRASGTYILHQFDTCAITQTYRDTIRIVLNEKTPLNLQPDTLKLCPGQMKTAGTSISLPGSSFRWEPAISLSGDSSFARFFADSLPKGILQYRLTVNRPNACSASDSVVVFNSPGPQGNIKASNPDSLLWFEGLGNYTKEWFANGGQISGPENQDSLWIQWAPYFLGQQVRLRLEDDFGCMADRIYLRPKPQVDTAIVVPDPPIQLPNLVTPDGNGQNDRFRILHLQKGDRVELQVFNRWGTKVFESDNYENNFPSTEQPNGVYFCRARVVGIRNLTIFEVHAQTWITVLGKY